MISRRRTSFASLPEPSIAFASPARLRSSGDFFLYLLGITRERDCFQNSLQTLTFGIFQFLDIFRIGKVWRFFSHQILSVFKTILQTPGPVLQRTSYGKGARGKASLIQGHQETDGSRFRIISLRSGTDALPFDEARDLLGRV